jgi:hypothetical protein
MKKLVYLFVIIFSQIIFSFGQTTCVWTGTTSSDFFDATNWQGGAVPQTSDNVLFDSNGGSNDCDMSAGAQGIINSFSVMSGYGGNINLGNNPLVLNGNLVINSGSVLVTTDIDFSGTGSPNFILGGTGIFDNTGGSISEDIQSGQVLTFSGNIVLNNLTLSGVGNAKRDIDFGSNLTVNDLVIGAAGKIHSFQGTVHIKNSLDVSGSSYTSLPSGNTANFIFDGSGASIVGSSNNLKMPLPNIEINTAGSYSISSTTQLNVRGNWTGTRGTLIGGSSTVNMYGSSASITGTAAAFDNLAVQASAIVNMPSNAEVKIGGTLTKNATGTINFQSTTVLGLNGSGSQSFSIGGGPYTMGGLHANSGSRTITLSTGIIILDSVKVDANVTLAAASSLTLHSTSALTARVAQLGTGASVTGNVTVETVIPGGTTGWANLGVSGVTGQTIANWDTYSSSSAANGIPMTCTGCTYDQTITGTWFNSIAAWNEPAGDYDTLIVASSSLATGKGYWIYTGNGQNTTSDLKVITTGPLVQGNVNIPLSSTTNTNGFQGYNLVANPYACPVSWAKVLAATGGTGTGLADAIYVWNADLGVSTSYVGGISSHTSGAITDVIPEGQGFYVQTNSVVTLAFTEAVKTTSNTNSTPLLKPTSSSYGQYLRLQLVGANDWDETVVRVHPGASNTFDGNWDAYKIFQSLGYAGYPGPYDKYTTISSKDVSNNDYSINSIPPLFNSVTIPILVKVSGSGAYTINAYDFHDLSVCVTLFDHLTNSSHDLRNSPYAFTISDTTAAPRFDLLLCRDESINPVLVKQNTISNAILINQDEQGPYVKTAFAQNTKAIVSIYNIMGQKLMNDISIEGTSTTTYLNLDVHNQVVFIKVTSDTELSTKKLVAH